MSSNLIGCTNNFNELSKLDRAHHVGVSAECPQNNPDRLPQTAKWLAINRQNMDTGSRLKRPFELKVKEPSIKSKISAVLKLRGEL